MQSENTRSMNADQKIAQSLHDLINKNTPVLKQDLATALNSLEAIDQKIEDLMSEKYEWKKKLSELSRLVEPHFPDLGGLDDPDETPKNEGKARSTASGHQTQQKSNASASSSRHPPQSSPSRSRQHHRQESRVRGLRDESSSSGSYISAPSRIANNPVVPGSSGQNHSSQATTTQPSVQIPPAPVEPRFTTNTRNHGATGGPHHVPIEIAQAGTQSDSSKKYWKELGQTKQEPDASHHPARRGDPQ